MTDRNFALIELYSFSYVNIQLSMGVGVKGGEGIDSAQLRRIRKTFAQSRIQHNGYTQIWNIFFKFVLQYFLQQIFLS